MEKKLLKHNNKYIKKELSMKYFPNISKNKKDLDEKIKEILIEEMNKECFDCGTLNPKYISINNGIFICQDCIKIHKQFTNDISLIKNNNLFLLSSKEILYLYYGGNSRLNNFVNYEFPGLQNYQPNILYRTQAMNYYRNRLNSIVCKKKRPEKPNSIFAYKLIGENTDKYSKNRLMFETQDNYYNKININKKEKNEGKKNLKFIYNNLNIKNEDYPRRQKINLDSIYQNNSINNTFNINLCQKINPNPNNKNIKGKKNILDNELWKNNNIYNNTFFKEMKNIFRENNIKGKIRMKLNDKSNEEKIDDIKDDLLTHQASLSHTIYFPKNELDLLNNNFNNYNKDKYFKKVNINKFTSTKNFNRGKNITLNNDEHFSKIYTKPRMSNNSFSKNYANNSTKNIKRNSIINGLTKFSLKKVNLKGDVLTNINRKEIKHLPKNKFLKEKSNTTENIFLNRREKNNFSERKNKLNYKLSNFVKNIINENKRELSFNNNNRKNIFYNNEHYKTNSNEGKKINQYNYKKRIFEKINDNQNISVNRKINIDNIFEKNINNNKNFIKVIKTKIGRKNNSDLSWKNNDNNNIKNLKIKINKDIKRNIKNIKLDNLDDNENINNIFLIEKSQENKIVSKAKKDKKEQEKIENEDFKKILLDEYCLYNNDVNRDILDKNDNDNCFCKLNLNKKIKDKNIEKNKEINNEGLNNRIDSNHQKNISNSVINVNNKENVSNNNDFYFFNKKNCTDLIILSKENNLKKNIFKENIIPKEFIIEANYIINFYKNKNEMEKNNSKIENYTKINKKIEIIEKSNAIKSNNISRNNSKKSIRNRYKQKTMLNLDKKNIINKNIDIDFINSNSIILNNQPNTLIDEGNICNNKEIKKVNISESNWNINQLGQINIYEEIIAIELD